MTALDAGVVRAAAQRLLDDDRRCGLLGDRLPEQLADLDSRSRASLIEAARTALSAAHARDAAERMFRGPGQWEDVGSDGREWHLRRARIARDETAPPRPPRIVPPAPAEDAPATLFAVPSDDAPTLTPNVPPARLSSF